MEANTGEIEDTLKVLADKTRLAIILALQTRPLTAGEIEAAIEKSQSATSQHLKKLTDANILGYRQKGTRKLFQVNDPQIFDLLYSIQSYISMRNVNPVLKMEQAGKIVFMGLDDGGKTSIILSMRGDRNLLSYCQLKPTSGIDIASELQAAYWECGGQVIYREAYLKDPFRLLADANQLVFVIDVQNVPRYQEALDYLGQIIETMVDNAIACDLAIYLHKWDPNLPPTGAFDMVQINNNLIGKIKSMIPPQFQYEIDKTTIFTVFRRMLLVQVTHS